MPGEQPTVEPRVSPQVQPNAALPMNATPQAYGAGVGEAVQGWGDAATRIHREALERANQTAVLDADNQTTEFIQKHLHDPKTGILNQNLGKDAPGAVDQVMADFDKHTAAQAGLLSNDQQRIAYQRAAAARRFEVERQLGQYEHAETTRYADQVDQASIAGATTTAVQNASDPQIVSDSIAQQKAVIADSGRRKGLPPETIAAQQTDAASQTHLGVLEQLLSTGQDQTASAWYAEHKGELTAQDSVRAARLVEAGSRAGEATRIADQITRASDGSTASRETVLDAIEKDPRLQADPKLRDAVETRSEHVLEQRQKAKAEGEKQAFQEAYAIAQDPQNPQGLYDPRVVTLMATMTPEQQEYLKGANRRGESDPVAVRDLMVQAASRPDDFLKAMDTDSPRILATVGKAGYQQLVEAEKEIRAKGTLGAAPGILTRAEVENTALVDAGFGRQAKSGATEIDRNAPGAQAFLQQFDTRVRATEAALKRAMTPQEVEKLGHEMVIEHVVRPAGTFGYGKPAPVYRLTPEQRDAASRDLDEYAKVEPAKAAQIRSNLASLAGRIGVAPDRLQPDQYNRAFAQMTVAQDLAASGDRVGAQRAVDQLDAILREAPRKEASGHQEARAARLLHP